MIAWLNGALTDHPVIDAADRGFTLGDGVFETMMYGNGAVKRLDRHYQRLITGLGLLGVTIGLDRDGIASAVDDVALAQGLAEGVVRLTVSRGKGERGIVPPAKADPTVLITLAPPPAPMGPARLMVATVTRRNEFSPLSGIKSLNYLDAILARSEALKQGFDDAVLLNTRGWVAETTVSNLFAVMDGVLLTPPLVDGVLPGVARALVIEHGGAEEASLSASDLVRADEIVLTNSLGARGVSSVGAVGKKSGPALARIQGILGSY
jgi:branched-chain amino acid aminotransferase